MKNIREIQYSHFYYIVKRTINKIKIQLSEYNLKITIAH